MTEFREIYIQDTLLRVYDDGEIERFCKTKWSKIKNTSNHKKGYNVIMIDNKQYMRSRIVCHVFNNLNLSSKYVIHYLDDDKLNCNIQNLSIETSSSLKSYYKNKNKNKV
jgi:hypothetical protein